MLFNLFFLKNNFVFHIILPGDKQTDILKKKVFEFPKKFYIKCIEEKKDWEVKVKSTIH